MHHSVDEKPARHFKGVALILLATSLFSCHDGISKHLTQLYPVIMVVWARYAVHCALMAAVFLPRQGCTILRSSRPGLQLVRGLALVATSLFFTSSLHYLPLAEATTIHFLAPLLVIVFSASVLGETATPRQMMAVVIGLAGTALIIRPGSHFLTPAVLLPFASALCFALYQLLTRRLSAYDSAVTSNFIGGLVATAVMSVMAPFFWQMPTLQDALSMLALGTLGMMSHLIFAKSYSYASPASLAPFTYAQIAFSTLIGAMIFSQAPDPISLAGIVVIAASGGVALVPKRHRVRVATPADGPEMTSIASIPGNNSRQSSSVS